MFALKLLGTLSLQCEAGTVPPEALQKRRLGLLALLAVGGERGISRDRLQSYLWPESSASKSRHALDQLIYATRRSLGSDPFVSEGGELRLDPATISTDIVRFDSAFREKKWAEAATAYGGPLLDGFYLSDSRELESLVDRERNRLEQQYHKALETLAHDAAAAGDHVGSTAWWKKLAASDRLSARVALETVKALDAAGDRVGAIQHARHYQQSVRSELDVDPDPRVGQLITSLSTHRSPVEPESWIPAAPHGAPAPATLPVHQRKPGRSRRAFALTSLVTVGFIAMITVLPGARDENPPSVSHTASRRQVDPEAKASYRRGLDAWSDRSKDGLDSAVIYFRRAIEIDPLYADAYGGLASAYVLLGYSGYRPSAAMFPKSRAAAFEAIKLDSELAAPYAALGMELIWKRKFDEAENAFHKAIAADPRYATAHQWYGILLMIVGRVSEAVTETGRAAELDPLSLQIQNNYATFLSASGDRAAATRQYQKMVGEEPDSAWVSRNPWLLTNMSSVYAANGKFDAALRAARRAVEIAPRHPRALLALASVHLKMGQPDSARRIFAQADSTNEHYYGHLGLLYVSLGKPDSAFAAFDRAPDWGIPLMISLRNARPLWNDPRYVALLERLGMPVIPTTTGHSPR